MVVRGFFSHVEPGGLSSLDRIRRTGYLSGARTFACGENIGFGEGATSSPRSMMRAWMNSAPHRANILTGRFREVGLGAVPGTPGRAARQRGDLHDGLRHPPLSLAEVAQDVGHGVDYRAAADGCVRQAGGRERRPAAVDRCLHRDRGRRSGDPSGRRQAWTGRAGRLRGRACPDERAGGAGPAAARRPLGRVRLRGGRGAGVVAAGVRRRPAGAAVGVGRPDRLCDRRRAEHRLRRPRRQGRRVRPVAAAGRPLRRLRRGGHVPRYRRHDVPRQRLQRRQGRAVVERRVRRGASHQRDWPPAAPRSCRRSPSASRATSST